MGEADGHATGGGTAGQDLTQVRQDLLALTSAHRALERRLDRAQTAALRTVTWVAGICILLGLMLPAYDEELASGSDGDAWSSFRLVQMPFYAFGPSAPGETSNGRALNIVMGIGFTGLLVVAIGVIVALIAREHGLADGWPRWCVRALSVLLIIGTCVVWLIGAAGAASGATIHWGTLVVLAVGCALAALLLITDARPRPGSE